MATARGPEYFFKFIYLETESVSRGEAETERKRERIPSILHTVSTEPDVGLEPTNCEIMT